MHVIVDILDLWHFRVLRHIMDHGDVTLVQLECVNDLINILDLQNVNALSMSLTIGT